MKKYRLKEKYKPAFQSTYHDAELTHDAWNSNGVTFEALEEVEERIELKFMYSENGESQDIRWVSKCGQSSECFDNGFTDQEKQLCEKALNGELLDIDSLDDADFGHWYYNNELVDVDYFDYAVKHRGVKAVLKEYLKEKK